MHERLIILLTIFFKRGELIMKASKEQAAKEKEALENEAKAKAAKKEEVLIILRRVITQQPDSYVIPSLRNLMYWLLGTENLGDASFIVDQLKELGVNIKGDSYGAGDDTINIVLTTIQLESLLESIAEEDCRLTTITPSDYTFPALVRHAAASSKASSTASENSKPTVAVIGSSAPKK